MFKKIAIVSASSLIGNSTTFVLMMISGRLLTVDEFAKLSLTVSASLMLVTLFDFGINTTLVKFYGATKDPELLNGGMSLKLIIFILVGIFTLASGTFLAALNKEWDVWVLGLMGGCVLSLWMGSRTVDQARENFGLYAWRNLLYAASRLLFGLVGLMLTMKAAETYVAAFIFPSILLLLIGQIRGEHVFSLRQAKKVAYLVGSYSVWVFVSAATYGATLYVPQFLIAHRLSDADVSSYGLALSFLGVAALIASSVRIVILPRLVANKSEIAISNLIQILKKYFPLYMIICSLTLCAGYLAINKFYSANFPTAAVVFLICGIGLLFTVYIGFFNLAIHVGGRPKLEAITNSLRLILLVLVLYVWGDSVNVIALIFSSVLIAGELSTALLVSRKIAKNI